MCVCMHTCTFMSQLSVVHVAIYNTSLGMILIMMSGWHSYLVLSRLESLSESWGFCVISMDVLALHL